MAEKTGIAWTDSTKNFWIGCTKVGPGCDNCYAEAGDKRFYGGVHWGAGSPRLPVSEKSWNEPYAWNRKAEASGVRRKVFCASQSDVFDNEVPAEWRERMWKIIRETPWLDWQLVTKRVSNIAKMLPPDWGATGYPNVWLIITVVTQDEADRDIPKLLSVPAYVHGLSMEPQIEVVEMKPEWLDGSGPAGAAVDWLITGGESLPEDPSRARPYLLEWTARIVYPARVYGRAVFVKQTGHRPFYCGAPYPVVGKGDVLEAWPAHLRVREFPVPHAPVASLDGQAEHSG